ncbi:MAG: glycosyltransferase family 2 protein [Candidatus Schekmanbacteria bacterium]|nr:glycosyltransferase family 2 protein [Candidatus Schekmanbacteria bacterium]
MKTNLSVIILTYNEEQNIAQVLGSVCGWAEDVLILDSFSTDRTLEIAREFKCSISQNKFENYAIQRNYALQKLPVKTEWVLFLDADEWAPDDLKNEITSLIASNPEENGYFIKWRLIWMGKWIKRGYYPTWMLRLFRYGKAHCEGRSMNEHIIVEGKTGYLKFDFIHEDKKGITDWIEKHNKYASREAEELFKNPEEEGQIDVSLFGTQAQRKRWLRYRIWNNLPPLIRPFIYFFYRYVLTGGFLDGRAAFIYHFLQGLWFQFLIDVKYLELKTKRRVDRGDRVDNK